MVVAWLGLVMIISIVGGIIWAMAGKPIPDGLLALGCNRRARRPAGVRAPSITAICLFSHCSVLSRYMPSACYEQAGHIFGNLAVCRLIGERVTILNQEVFDNSRKWNNPRHASS